MELRKEDVTAKLEELFRTLPGNVIEGDVALPGCDGLVMYDTPLIGFASAADPLFEQYKDPKIIGKPYMTPEEWLPGAQTVVSMFLPFTKEVKQANRGNPEETANEWLHARIEGQNSWRTSVWLCWTGLKRTACMRSCQRCTLVLRRLRGRSRKGNQAC